MDQKRQKSDFIIIDYFNFYFYKTPVLFYVYKFLPVYIYYLGFYIYKTLVLFHIYISNLIVDLKGTVYRILVVVFSSYLFIYSFICI